MAEYIEREKLPKRKEYWDDDFGAGWDACLDAIDTIPAADVRPVVVCANCEHNNACLTQAFVEEASRVPFDRNTFFCADGKRADDA